MAQLSDNDITRKVQDIAVFQSKSEAKKQALDEVDLKQISLFDTVKDEDIIQELKSIEIATLTPLEALNTLHSLQNKLNNRW